MLRRRRGFTIVEFTLAMLLTLVVLAASSLAIERAMGSLKDGTARDGAVELAYQVLAKERVFGCGLGVGAGHVDGAAFPEDKIAALCTGLWQKDTGSDSTDPNLRCDGDANNPVDADYQPGSCFELNSLRDPAHVKYRVYVRSIWRGAITGAGVAPTGCWAKPTAPGAKDAPNGEPSLLEREVVVRYQRNGVWSKPVVATGLASTATSASIVATGANMVPDGVPFTPQTTTAVAGQLSSARSELVDLTVTVPGQAPQLLRRWADDAGCVWFPFIPANATVASARLGIPAGTPFTADGTGNLNIGRRGA